MKKLKDLLKESYVWERKFGESLPTLKEIEKKYKKKLNEAKMHGFDLTDFRSERDFKKILKDLKIKPTAIRGDDAPGRKQSGWVWKGNGIMIVTGNNPITGEFYSQTDGKPSRKSEKGYASYMGVEGNAKQVELAVDLIKKHASYIKNESPGRRTYI